MGSRAALESLVGTFDFGEFLRCADCCVVDGFKDAAIDLNSLFGLEGDAHPHVGISESLNTDPDWPMAFIASLRLLYRVVV